MTRKLDTLAILFQAMRSKTYVDKTIGQLTKVTVDHHAGLKNWADELRKLATANIALHLVLNKKSELDHNDKGVFSQVCIDVF